MNYRRKDYFLPCSMREAFGDDFTYEPEIRCCSELFVKRNRANKHWVVFVIAVAVVICCIAAFS